MKHLVNLTLLLFLTILPSNNILANTVSDMFELMLENPEIQKSRTQMEIAKQKLENTSYNFMPQIQGQISRTASDRNTSQNSENNTSYRTLLNQNIYNGFTDELNQKIAQHEYKIAVNNYKSLVEDKFYTLITEYFNILKQYSILNYQNQRLELVDKYLDMAEIRFQNQNITENDLIIAKNRQSQVLLDIENTKFLIQSQIDKYLSIVSDEIAIEYLPEENTTTEELITQIQNMLTLDESRAIIDVVSLKQNNFMIANAILARKIANLALSQAENQHYPKLDFILRLEKNTNHFMYEDNFEKYAGLNLNIPIFVPNILTNKWIKSLNATYSDYSIDDIINSIELQSKITIQSFQSLTKSLNIAKSIMESNKVIYEGVFIENKLGKKTSLDLLDSEENLFLSKVNYISIFLDRYITYYRIMLLKSYLMKEFNIDSNILFSS